MKPGMHVSCQIVFLMIGYLWIFLPVCSLFLNSFENVFETLQGFFFSSLNTFDMFRALLPSVQFSTFVHSCLTLCDPMNCSTPGLPVHHQLSESTQTHVHWVGDAIRPSHPLLSPSPAALNLSQHQGLFTESALHIRWPKYWSFSFNISPTNEHPGLISFRWTG